jgi:hypothetical protein
MTNDDFAHNQRKIKEYLKKVSKQKSGFDLARLIMFRSRSHIRLKMLANVDLAKLCPNPD